MRPAYERDHYLRELATTIADVGDDGRPFVVLEDTVLYPEGGGQPSDRGWLTSPAGDLPVIDAQAASGAIRHYLQPGAAVSSATAVGAPVRVHVDWPRRYELMQHHTAEHLLAATALARFGWRTRSFHLGEELSTIDFDVPALGRAQLDELEQAATESIGAACKISARWVTAEEYAALPVRSRGLPEGHRGDLRLVEIAGVDLNTCGGTHVRSTAEIGALHLLDCEGIRGASRVTFVVGERLRRRLAAHEARAAELRALLSTEDSRLVERTRGKLEELAAAGQHARAIERELATALARELAARSQIVVADYLPARAPEFLLAVGKAFMGLAPARTLLLSCGAEGAGAFLVATGKESGLDLRTAAPAVLRALAGTGGGSQFLLQGRTPRPAQVKTAAAALERQQPDPPGAGSRGVDVHTGTSRKP